MRPDTVMRWIVVMLLGWTPALADGPPAGAPPPAPVLVSIDLPGTIDWYYRNDAGVLLVYASDRLYRLGLLHDPLRNVETAFTAHGMPGFYCPRPHLLSISSRVFRARASMIASYPSYSARSMEFPE